MDFLGLSEQEAANRFSTEGPNELPSKRPKGLYAIALEVVREPMFLLLVSGALIYFALGDLKEAVMLLSSVLVILTITFFQERKTERALEALRDLSNPRAVVIREGQRKRIAGREVVRGDLLVLTEGERVPADARLLSCNDLSVDESLLTGESFPVQKVAWNEGTEIQTQPGGDNLPFVYSGTMLVQGQGIGEAIATGTHTEIGKIGKALESVETEETPLKKETAKLVRVVGIMGLIVSSLVVVLYGVTRHDWLQGILSGITLTMSLIPEEFPVVLTVFLALGAWRLSQNHVLTRRIPAIETLGQATVLCVDKTGTLTQNHMSVRKVIVQGSSVEINEMDSTQFPEQFHEPLEFSILASEIDPFDPMEKAFHNLGSHFLAEQQYLHKNWQLVHEYPLSASLRAMTHVWMDPSRKEYVVAVKGAPEAIAELCRFDDASKQALLDDAYRLSIDGSRVIATAKAFYSGDVWPEDPFGFDFQYLGIFGLADPIRPTVRVAVEQCYEAGIRVVMITGDYPSTAQAIGTQIGLQSPGEIITGMELAQMSDSTLQSHLASTNIFARVVPEQKLRLVQAFKRHGDIVAMTGDGVNDAPALKAAHIGIAMGERGTDVAREASSIVLLDDDFESILQAIRGGRRIFDNLQKSMSYIAAIHIPIAGTALIPLLLHWPTVLWPVHIVFLELIIDPACSIAFEAEPEEEDVMKRKPRGTKETLLVGRSLTLSFLKGFSVLLAVMLVLRLSIPSVQEAQARTLAFATLVMGNLFLIYSTRSKTHTIFSTFRVPNPAMHLLACAALVFLGLAIYVPYLRELFQFSPLSITQLLVCVTASFAGILSFEVLKIMKRRSL